MRMRRRRAAGKRLVFGVSSLALVVTLSSVGCNRASYLVSGSAIDVGRGIRLCPPDVTSVSFRLGTHDLTRPFLDVRLVVEAGRMRSLDTGGAVALQRRNDLDIPEKPPGP